MITRVLTAAILTAGTLAFASAYAQTTGSGSSTTTPGTTTSPSTPSPTMGTGSSQTAQQPMGSFDVTKYKTKTECMNAATTAKADMKLCDTIKTQ